MASNRTEHYGLSLWEPEDAFIRREFNADHERLDASLRRVEGKADRAADRLALVGYNVYNLLLQNYYDGKKTGYKKALVFDGFQDGDMIRTISPSLVRKDGRLSLSGLSQGDVSSGYSSEAYAPTGHEMVAGPHAAAGYGTLTGLKVKTIHGGGKDEVGKFTFRVSYNDQIIQSGTMSLWFRAAGSEERMSFTPIQLKPGDRFHVEVETTDPNCKFYGSATSGSTLGGTFTITPAGGQAGTVTTPALALPERERLRAWVRFQGGSVGLSASGPDGVSRPMTAVGDRQTVNLQGAGCTEREFALEEVPAGALAFTLALELSGSEYMEVYDYGVMAL